MISIRPQLAQMIADFHTDPRTTGPTAASMAILVELQAAVEKSQHAPPKAATPQTPPLPRPNGQPIGEA